MRSSDEASSASGAGDEGEDGVGEVAVSGDKTAVANDAAAPGGEH